jgi:hypothetical protein
MYRDPRSNIDGAPLEADHTTPRSLGGTVADRLLLAVCNRSRGNGTRLPAQRPAPPAQPQPASRDWFG